MFSIHNWICSLCSSLSLLHKIRSNLAFSSTEIGKTKEKFLVTLQQVGFSPLCTILTMLQTSSLFIKVENSTELIDISNIKFYYFLENIWSVLFRMVFFIHLSNVYHAQILFFCLMIGMKSKTVFFCR